MIRSCRKQFLFAVLLLVLTASATLAQSTSFTYQGKLTDGGTPANGNYDLQFALFDTVNSSVQIGPTQTIPNVSVSDGIFTVTLDFGSNSFPGQNRFLSISTRPSGSGVYTTLTPRQMITSSPYAVRSLNSANADLAANAQQLGGTPANQYVKTDDPRLSDSRTPAGGSTSYIQNTGSPQAAQFNVLGNGTVMGLLTGNLVNSNVQYMLGGQRFAAKIGVNGILLGPPNAPLVLGDGANVGIGTEIPSSSIGDSRALEISGSSAVLRLSARLSHGHQFEWQSTVFGSSAALNLRDAFNSTNPLTVLGNGNVGIGNTTPTARLDVNGNLKVANLGSAGTTQVCLNAANELSNCSSSLRYKTDFNPFNRGLNLINKLQPLTFTWKSDNSLDLGLGAEDVAKIEPLLVVRNDQGDVEGVKYDRLSVVFINAFKEQQTQIETLRRENELLNARLQSLEKTLKRQPARQSRR